MMKRKAAALTACSDALTGERVRQIGSLRGVLCEMGVDTKLSPFMFTDGSPFSGSASEKAQALNSFFADNSVSEIFDVSGGDLANGVLPYLDYDLIKSSYARFWGYSDLTTVINAIYTKTGKSSVLYQARNILVRNKDIFERTLSGGDDLFLKSARFINGEKLSGTFVGGNIRCFLKLSGTEYFPELTGKVLLLESLGGAEARIVTLLDQLAMLGAFQRTSGVLLGTFTELDEKLGRERSLELISAHIMQYNASLPIAFTDKIGHYKDALAVEIGKDITYEKGK